MKNGENERDGYKRWRADDPKAILLLVHGIGAHSGRWDAAAAFFLKKNISSYAVELWDPKAAGKAADQGSRFRSYYDKITSLHAIISRENPSKKIFLVGESLGALVSFLFCAARPDLFSGLICLSPAFATKNKVSTLDCIKMLAPIFYDPGRQFSLLFDSSMCTRDEDYRRMMDRDPLEYRSISSKMIFDILLAQAHAGMEKNKISVPVLFLLAGEDKIVDAAQARRVFNSLAVKDKALVEFPGMYHSLSVDLGKESVFEEMSKWMEEHI
ncbi:MAG: alpha/beta fold hydrolase [Candidatus Omnitrophota bacterium]|jgi:alpha-beta hydrolase superfamily lysophospholipase